MTFIPKALRIFPLALLPFISACERKEVKTYIAPKDKPLEETQPDAASTQTPTQESPSRRDAQWQPKLTWVLPAGWTEAGPDSANLARITTSSGPQVAVTALASLAGQDGMLVNMYRQMKGEEPLSDEEAAKQLQTITVAGTTGKLLEVADSQEGKTQRFLVAFVHKSEGSLFFKITGDDAAVLGEKPAFLEFAKSIKIEEPTLAASKPVADLEHHEHDGHDHSNDKKPSASPALPEGWTQLEPGSMQVAKFAIKAADAKAEVAISVFPSDTGGTLSNVKRWRGQLDLTDASDEEVMKTVKPLPGGKDGAVLIELVNEARSITGAIVPKDGKWWFFKMTGDTAAVSTSRDTFVNFVNTAP